MRQFVRRYVCPLIEELAQSLLHWTGSGSAKKVALYGGRRRAFPPYELRDKNLDHCLRKHLGTHEVFTVTYKGWAGFKNGELLRTAEAGIEVFLTGDQTLVHEQNLAGRQLAIVALASIEFSILKDDLPGSFQTGECGRFNS